ncbi:LOW QUALITY PROTEIN: uncharacterized protein [Palaemon carinicauda]|uniref:LOW QUALITY PROTEIN: uncharacterized protein n=1 Tax=Palaemon carinicauda TaxID=392227 RepID=UPI0035B69002
MMGSRVGDVLASRKPYVGGQLARHPASSYSDHQGVVEEGRGRGTSSSKVSKIAGMFQGGVGGGVAVGGSSSSSSSRAAPAEDEMASSGSSSHDGPHHATVVRTESHLARFNNARALFEKMGQGEAPSAPAQPRLVAAKPVASSRGEAKLSDLKTETKLSKFESKVDTSKAETRKITGPSSRTHLTSHHLRRPHGGGGGSSSSDERGGRGESISPARSIGGTSSSSSRSASPSPARTTNGHAHHSDQETGGIVGGGVGTATVGVSSVLGLRRPGSATSSRSLSTSSTESEPPRRWPPGKVSSASSTSTSSTAVADSNVTSRLASLKAGDPAKSDGSNSDLRKLKPEKPAKPEGLDRRISAHEQHQELINRHKNWFQTFSKNRSPASSPVKPDSRPESPNKAEGRPTSPGKAEDALKSEWKSTQPSKSELRYDRSHDGSDEKETQEETRKEKNESVDEDSKDDSPRKVDEQEAWSSVLQSRYGSKARDLLSPRGRAEGDTSTDWRKERAAILSSRTGQRHSSSEDETAAGPIKGGHYRVTDASSRFEDTATLQSSWSPPPNYNVTETSQSTVVKTLKEEINIAETERTKSARQQQHQQQAVKENGNAHESSVGVGGTVENEDENVVLLVERKEKADLIVSESVVIKDSTKEKDIEKRHYESSTFSKTDSSSTTTLSSTTSTSHSSATTTTSTATTTSSSSSSTSSPSSATVSSAAALKRGEEHVIRPVKKPGSSKETSEEVNLKLKESISGGQSVEEISSSTSYSSYSERRDYRQELEERRARRLEEDRLSSREEVIETRIKENVTTERRKEEITDRRRRDEIAESRRRRDDSSDSWRDEASDHRRRRGAERRDDAEMGVRGKDRSEEYRTELTHREKSEERIRQIRKSREARSRERREESLEKSDLKSSSETESRSSSGLLHHEPVAQILSSSHRRDEQVTTSSSSTVTHYRTETHATSYEPKSYVTHAKIPTSGAASDPAPPPTLHVETEKKAEVEDAAPTVKSLEGGEVVETVVIGGVLSALKAETVYVSSTEDLSQNDDSKRESRLDIYKVDLTEGEAKEKADDDKEKEEPKEKEEVVEEEAAKDVGDPLDSLVRRQLFPDVVAECQLVKGPSEDQDSAAESGTLSKEEPESETKEKEEDDDWRRRIPDPIETQDLVERISPPPSPCALSLAALDALIHGTAPGTGSLDQTPYTSVDKTEGGEEEEEILYDHTVTSAQHKIQFCTTPVTVEGIVPDSESHDTDPEPLPPPIPPHAVDPEVMTADEADRLLSANIVEGKKVRESQSILSDEEAQEVVLLLSPPNEDPTKTLPPPPPPIPPHHGGEGLASLPPHYDIPPVVPPHYADITPPIPPHFGPNEDEFDTRVASHFDQTLASPLSPEDEPSEADSSEEAGDIGQVSRVKEVLVEDGVHYLEDGHFWVEVPGLPEDDDEEDNDPTLPFHPHTKLSFSKDPIQVFSTYSVTEYDRKNDEVDPVAASAEYELEKRVEKMDLFPVEIIKGEGGLGLSIIGMGVGADAGVEKLGIFVKTITVGGATERDGRIQVNDQIIEVDGKSLVGVTQVFAASVLKNTSGRVYFLIGREKDPENSEVALLIKQSLQADREREERRRALGGPDYDPHTGNGLFDPMSSPSEENSRSEEVPQNYSSYLEGGSSPTSDAVSPPIESFDLEGDTSDTSPENDAAILKLKLKEIQYKNAVAEAEITKLKMTLLEMEKIVTENVQYSSQLNEAQIKAAELNEKLQSKLSEVSTYQDMLEQSQGQYIILEKKYYKAKKIIKEYQSRERDFLHREEYHITQLEDKDSHYNALVKALKDRVINLEEELKNAQKKAGLPVEVPTDISVQPAYLDLQQSAQSALAKQPPRKPSLSTFDPEISDTETSDNGASEGDKANTVERKLPVKEELDEAVPPHELLDVSASRAKGELAARGGLANRHLPSLKKTTSMSSAGSQDHSLDDSSLDDDLPEAQKHAAAGETSQDTQMDQGSRRSAEPQEITYPQSPVHQSQSPLQPPISSSQIPQHSSFNSISNQTKSTQPPSYSQATMGNISYLGSPPPPYQPPPNQFGIPRQPLAPSDPSTGLPSRSLSGAVDTHAFESRSESRPEIPYRHPPPVARVLPVNRAEISESASLAAHLANRTPQQQSLAEQLKALLAEREVQGEIAQKNDREASPSKRSPTSLMEDVRQAVLQADVSSSVPTPHYKPYMGKKPVISAPVNLSSTAHVVSTGQIVQQVNSPNRSQQSAVYSLGGRDSIRDSNTGSLSPKLGRSSIHASPLSGVSPNPSGVVLLSQRPIDSSLPIQKLLPGVDGSSGDLSSGPASLGSGDEGSGASLGSQTSLSHTHIPGERSKRSHMWQTAPVIDWTKEQVSQWLVVQGLESCVGRFQEIGMTGPRLLNLDIRDLKALGVPADEKSKLKRKVKELRLAVEKERKQAEKEKKERERLQKKAEKLAEKAEKKKK